MAREGRDLLEPRPSPEAQAVDQDQGWPLTVDIIVYAGAFGDYLGHVVISCAASYAVIHVVICRRASNSPLVKEYIKLFLLYDKLSQCPKIRPLGVTVLHRFLASWPMLGHCITVKGFFNG